MSHFFTLYTVGTPNGHKISIALEELGIPYKVYHIQFSKNEQKEEWFLKINPNGRIPALIDHRRGDFAVFESGAILLYLAEHYDPEHKISFEDANLHSQSVQWLMWQMSGLGPMQGQANHFARYAPTPIPYAIDRYKNETLRLYNVMERGLTKNDNVEEDVKRNDLFLVGNKYSIADIACVGWISAHAWCGLTLDATPRLKAWLYLCTGRPATRRGLDVPEPNKLVANDFKVDETEAEKKAKEAQAWILKK